jgi:hypothetical protein
MLPPILEALVAAHGTETRLDPCALFAAGWPGERAQPSAAVHRGCVALSKLRSQGLEGLLHRDDAGWYPDPERPVLRVESVS